jgi:hypothetical protein
MVFEDVSHHEKRQDEADNEQWDTKDQADAVSLTQRETDYQAGNKRN